MFKSWPKIPRLENEIYHISEKIDGTNACIIIQKYTGEEFPKPLWVVNNIAVHAQSRTRLITPEEDNYGFAKWVQDNAEQLIEDLGVGYHFGEWWGQGINRGYELDHKRFSLFNPTKQSSICYNIPLIVSTTDLLEGIKTAKSNLEIGSLVSPGYMKPEGLVIYAEKAKTYWKVIID